MAIERGAEALQRLEQPREFLGLAAVRQRDHDVARLDHAEVAVHGLGRVQEEGGRAGARERRGDLAADDARLAHAGDDDAAAAVADQRDGAREALVEPIDERPDGGRLGLQHLAGERQISHRTSRSGRTRDQLARAAPRARSSGRALAASLLARRGSSWTSMKMPSTPAATPARASGAMYSRQAGGHAVAGAGQLQAVGHVEDDRVAELAHHRQAAHVDDQVVVAERRAALGERARRWLPLSTSFATTWRMSRGARNWPFLTLTARPGPARRRPAGRSAATGTPGSAARRRRRPPARPARARGCRSGPAGRCAP